MQAGFSQERGYELPQVDLKFWGNFGKHEHDWWHVLGVGGQEARRTPSAFGGVMGSCKEPSSTL